MSDATVIRLLESADHMTIAIPITLAMLLGATEEEAIEAANILATKYVPPKAEDAVAEVKSAIKKARKKLVQLSP